MPLDIRDWRGSRHQLSRDAAIDRAISQAIASDTYIDVAGHDGVEVHARRAADVNPCLARPSSGPQLHNSKKMLDDVLSAARVCRSSIPQLLCAVVALG